MKLVFCLKCQDLFKLHYNVRKCRCGKSRGRYLDNLYAEYAGTWAMPVGIANGFFWNALKQQPKEGMGVNFEAFVIPIECPTFKKVKNLRKKKVSLR